MFGLLRYQVALTQKYDNTGISQMWVLAELYILSFANMLKVGTDCLSHELRATGQRERYEYFTAFSPSTCKFNSFSFWSVSVNYSCAGMRWVCHKGRERERECFICSLMQVHNLHSPACLCHLSALKFTKIKKKIFLCTHILSLQTCVLLLFLCKTQAEFQEFCTR